MEDVRRVLTWLGYEPAPCETYPRSWLSPRYGEVFDATRLDANWIHGTLIPALEERLISAAAKAVRDAER